MNGALREAEVVDPSWAKKERRKQLLLMAATGGALVAIAIGTVAFVLGIHNSTEITQIRHSACEVEPEGEACQLAKRESAKAESIATACIPFHQVGYRCPKPGSKAERHMREVMPSTPTTGNSPSGPSPGGPTDTPSKSHGPSVPHQSPGGHESGGEEGPAAIPTPAPSPSSPKVPPTSTVERSTETVVVQPPAPEAEPPVRSAVGGLIEEVGSTATGTVEGLTGTTCEVAKLLCRE